LIFYHDKITVTDANVEFYLLEYKFNDYFLVIIQFRLNFMKEIQPNSFNMESRAFLPTLRRLEPNAEPRPQNWFALNGL